MAWATVLVFVATGILAICIMVSSRSMEIGDCVSIPRQPNIFPDYTDVVIPPNIAPLNFTIKEPGSEFQLTISASGQHPIHVRTSSPGMVIPRRRWRSMLEANKGKTIRFTIYSRENDNSWRRFEPIEIMVAEEDIDPYLVYRKIPPMHRKWHKIGIYQRALGSYDEKAVIENRNFGRDGCVNCHTFRQNSTETMSLQIRSPRFGVPMVIHKDGRTIEVDTRTAKGISPAAYHSWHPNGNLIAFSRNKPSPFEHTRGHTRDVWDDDSDLAVYFVDANRVECPPAISMKDQRETWPSWSSDGKHLYFCRTVQTPFQEFFKVRYDLMRVSYDETSNTWGEPEVLVSGESAGLSTAQPRESPDGKWLVFSMFSYGNFPIYKPDTDLYIMDLRTLKYRKMNLNSDLCDSWHSWSSNGRWLVFSSKRGNGLLAKPYFSYFDKDGVAHKPFALPQRDPAFYESCLFTYNVPELVKDRVPASSSQLARVICDPDATIKASGSPSAE
jgi:hypothetical protein